MLPNCLNSDPVDQPLSLHELLGRVKAGLKSSLPFPFWVVAEISELKVNYSGHCYIELVEKDPESESIRAKARATIWASAFRMIRPYFETTAGTQLTAGMKVMVRVAVEFHEQFGLSLNITDIEPSYTLGDLARRKQEVLNRLKADGVFDMNRSLSLSPIPSRIAVISSKTAAGYGDFLDQLSGNAFGYKFYVKLFPAIMQGDESETSVIAALDKVFALEYLFDAVVMIRGGGSQSDLSCFNSYGLAANICQFPLPVLTGIGHEQDETVADLVAHTRLKTPTAVAEFLIGLFREADERINELSYSLADAATALVRERRNRLERLALLLKPLVSESLADQSVRLERLGVQISNSVKRNMVRDRNLYQRNCDRLFRVSKQVLLQAAHRIDLLQNRTTYLDPFHILKRGYSVTYFNGKAVKDPGTIPEGSVIHTRLAHGTLKSKTT